MKNFLLQGGWLERCTLTVSAYGLGQFLAKQSIIAKDGSQQKSGPRPSLTPPWLCDVHLYSPLKTQFQRLTAQAEQLSWVSSHSELYVVHPSLD